MEESGKIGRKGRSGDEGGGWRMEERSGWRRGERGEGVVVPVCVVPCIAYAPRCGSADISID